MKTKQWIVLAVWFVCYMAAMEFLRFKFGIFMISGVAVVVGIPLMLLVGKPQKKN